MSPIVHPDRAAELKTSESDVVHISKTVTVPSRLKHVERIFENQDWLAGNQPTIADAYFYGVARKAKEFINFKSEVPLLELISVSERISKVEAANARL